MRLSFAAMWLSVAGIAAAGDASAAIRKFTNIPAKELGEALQTLAQEHDVQVVYLSEGVDKMHTAGAVGELTVDEALERLLAGTGLAYRYIDDRTITLLPAERETAGGPAEQVKLEEVVVSAQKKLERLQDVPVPVSVLDADALASNSQVLLRDYYMKVPGFTVAPYYTAAQNLTIRGITTGGFTNPTVGVTIDDVPYTGSIGQGGTGGLNVPDFDPGDLKRIEVLRGPQGTLYGSNSMGGLVKYVTTDPSTDALSGRFMAGLSSVRNGADPGFNVRGYLNAPVTETLGVRLSAFQRQDPGYIDNVAFGIDGVNRIRAEGARLSALWKPAADVSLKLAALYQDNDLAGLHEVTVAPGLGELDQNYAATLPWVATIVSPRPTAPCSRRPSATSGSPRSPATTSTTAVPTWISASASARWRRASLA